MNKELFQEHVAERQRRAEAHLEATGFQEMVLHSGTPFRYFADDMDAPHHATPHFAHWCPLEGPYHMLRVRPGEKPLLLRVAPEDFWYEQAPLGDPFWADAFEIREVPSEEAAWKEVRTKQYTAYIGDAPSRARDAGGVDESGLRPTKLLALLDWDRGTKTAYEVACTEEAERVAAKGHAAAKAAFEGGASELEIHQAYVAAAGCVDKDLPYESIVALDEKGAILHYSGKRSEGSGEVLLIDAGARALGYCSDITRTWTLSSCDETFRELVTGMDALQRELCDEVKPGLPYPELHHMAHVRIGDLLNRTAVLKIGGEDAVELGLTSPFFPHGLGHFLGIQVHDVGGHQKEPTGGTNPPDERWPALRTTRTIEAGHLFTIEPGLYFIPMLLRDHRTGSDARAFDWDLIDRLTPLGGVRIEDNVLVTADGHRNLTRPYV